MALRAVADHPKLSRLKALLNCGRGEAMGYLEALWHFTGRFTPQGNVGKYSDAEIEAWIEWGGNAGILIAALIESRWIDPDPVHRLLVHDWHDYADDCVNADMARKQMTFANGTIPSARRLNQTEREKYKAWVGKKGFEVKSAGSPAESSQNSVTKQPECSQAADNLQTVCVESADCLSENVDNVTKPVPVPVPVPEPEEQEQKPSRGKREGTKTALAQSRHEEFKVAISFYWQYMNPGVEMPWGPAEGKNLGMWLRESPQTTVEQFKVYLRHRARSDITHSERPSAWIRNITNFAAGPLDRYGKPKGATNGKYERTREALRTALEDIQTNSVGNHDQTGGSELLPGRGTDRRVLEDDGFPVIEGKPRTSF